MIINELLQGKQNSFFIVKYFDEVKLEMPLKLLSCPSFGLSKLSTLFEYHEIEHGISLKRRNQE